MKNNKLNFILIISFMMIILSFTENNSIAQEIGISPTKMFTDNTEMGSPVGIGFYYFQPLGFFGLKLEYAYFNNSREYFGRLIYGFFSDPPQYEDEDITSKANYSSAEVGLYFPSVVKIIGNDINLGAGFSLDTFDCERTASASGRATSTRTEKKYGYFYTVSVSRRGIFRLPVKLELLFQHKTLSNQSEVTDIEQPFDELDEIKEIQLNIAYYFR